MKRGFLEGEESSFQVEVVKSPSMCRKSPFWSMVEFMSICYADYQFIISHAFAAPIGGFATVEGGGFFHE